MAFPEVPRVFYEISPLDEVICQVKFPPILRIEAELPAAFQEQVRGEFPLFDTIDASPLPPDMPDDLARILQATPGSSATEHQFTSGDKQKVWQLRLTRSRLGLACCGYTRWEHFRERLVEPHRALLTHYRPAVFQHICLRYRNVIRRSQLEIGEDIPWSDLLTPWVCGFLAAPGVAGNVEMARAKAATRLGGEIGWLDVEYGLTQEPDGEQSFVIDAHLFDNRDTEPSDAFERLDSLHRQAGHFFRWCITDRLHDALRPQPSSVAVGGGERA